MADAYTGEIRMFGFNYAPRNWGFCDGQILSIQQFPVLFSIISNLYGGDGRTSMALPDLRARVPMGPRQGPGLTPRYLSEVNGVQGVRLNPRQLPAHTHTANSVKSLGTETAATAAAAGIYSVSADDVYKKDPTAVNQPMSVDALASAGHNDLHLNMQPYLVASFCICLDGIYPSRS